MSLCANCGLSSPSRTELCPYHHASESDEWAVNNRAVCDWLHRGVPLPRLARAEREDVFWATASE